MRGFCLLPIRFKVLSLDQAGNEFMVMMDVDQSFDHRAERLGELEAKIVQIAKSRYEFRVTAVYWRIFAMAVPRNTKAVTPGAVQAAVVQRPENVNFAPRKGPGFRYEPIQADEVAAFKRALVAASANSTVSADAASKTRSGPHSYTLLTGYEDTEMTESTSTPALSTTQYGDLN